MSSTDILIKVEQAVEQVESASAAEVVVSFCPSAGVYAEAALRWSIMFGLATVAFLIWSPFHFHAELVPLNVLVMGAVGYLLGRKSWSLRRLVLSEKRLEKAVEQAARAQFLELGVDQTRERTGLLLLVCRFERRLFFVPDSKLRKELSPAFWTEINTNQGRFRSEEELLAGITGLLEKISGPLARQCPRQDDDVNELPNRPVERV